jgi:hypothetical protein
MNTLHCLEEWRSEQRISPQGKLRPRGPNSLLGDKFAPRREVKNGPLVTLFSWKFSNEYARFVVLEEANF